MAIFATNVFYVLSNLLSEMQVLHLTFVFKILEGVTETVAGLVNDPSPEEKDLWKIHY